MALIISNPSLDKKSIHLSEPALSLSLEKYKGIALL